MPLDELLNDSAHVPDVSEQTLMNARIRLSSAIDQRTAEHERDLRTRAIRRSKARSANRRRLVISTVSLAAAASLAIALPTVILPGGNTPIASASAAELLQKAGAAAGAQTGDWKNAEYWHSTSTYYRDGVKQTRDIWIGHHQIGVLKDAGVSRDSNQVMPLDVASFWTGTDPLTWDDLWSLPTDSDALFKRFAEDTQWWADKNPQAPQYSEVFTVVGDLLRESPAPPALRKALFGVLSRIPDVKALGEVTDELGRKGQAVQLGGQKYVIDPENGTLLAEGSTGDWQATYVSQGPSATAPAVTFDPAQRKKEAYAKQAEQQNAGTSTSSLEPPTPAAGGALK